MRQTVASGNWMVNGRSSLECPMDKVTTPGSTIRRRRPVETVRLVCISEVARTESVMVRLSATPPLQPECLRASGTTPLARSPDTGVNVYGAGATICTESQIEAVASN